MAAAQPRGAGGPGSPGQARRGQRGRRGRRPRGRRRRASRRLRPRADQGRAPRRGAFGPAACPPSPAPSPDSWGANPSWDVAPDRGVTSANGNHSARHGNRGPFDAALTSISDAAEPAEPAPAAEFSWLQKSQQETRPADSELTWPEPADTGLASPSAAGPAPSQPGVTEQIPQHLPRRAEVTGADRLLGQAGSPAPGRPAPARHGATSRRADDRAGVLALACRHRHALSRGTRSPECYRLGPAAQHVWIHGAGDRWRPERAPPGPVLHGATAGAHRHRRAHRQRAGAAAEVTS